MTAVLFTDKHVRRLKKALIQARLGASSGHLSEALARAAGFQTMRAFSAALPAFDQGTTPQLRLLDVQAFQARLLELNPTARIQDADQWFFETIGLPVRYPYGVSKENLEIWRAPKPHPPKLETAAPAMPDFEAMTIVATRPRPAEGERFRPQLSTGLRKRACRNLLVLAINESIRRGYFTVFPGSNAWPEWRPNTRNGFQFDMNAPDRTPMIVELRDIGWDEISLTVAFNPVADYREQRSWAVKRPKPHLELCDAHASMLSFERRIGAYITRLDHLHFGAKRQAEGAVASMSEEAIGYGDGFDVVWPTPWTQMIRAA